jgi:trehalose/maltose hydrolase-like predicted phosphorylase
MAGTIDLVQRCYSGIETRQNQLQVNPYLPNELKEIQFDMMYRQHWVNLLITPKRLIVRTRPHAVPPITVGFREDTSELKPGDTLQFDLQ